MKKISAILAVATLLIPIGAISQNRTVFGNIVIHPVTVAQQGDSLHINMDVLLDENSLRSRMSVELTPILTADSQQTALAPIVIKGRNNYKSYLRRMALLDRNDRQQTSQPFMLLRAFGKAKYDTATYCVSMPYKLWMEGSHIEVNECVTGCNQQIYLSDQAEVAGVVTEPIESIAPYTITPFVSFVQPAVEQVKRRDVQAEVYLDFAVNQSVIRPGYGNNPTELQKITSMIDEIRSDTNITVRSLDITGYASPEGSLSHNKWLSEQRAYALRNYLSSKYPFPKRLYSIRFGGENWQWLDALVEKSDMPARDEVLRIIRTVSLEDGRETQIMKLQGGVPYRYMLKEMFPKLRVAICTINYDVCDFNVEQAKQVILTRPQNLSLNEMYLVAETYDHSSPEFVAAFRTAAQYFPDDATANINAAAASLAEGDTVAAEAYMSKLTSQDSHEVNNLRGVEAMLTGDYASARTFLERASAAGNKDAAMNLEELDRKEANINQIKQQQERLERYR